MQPGQLWLGSSVPSAYFRQALVFLLRIEVGSFMSWRPGLTQLLRCLCLALLSCAVQAADKVVRVGTGDWVPYLDQNQADGGALGRLVQAIFQQAGYRVEFLFHPWDRNLLLLQQGSLDAVMPYICSEARQQISLCSDEVLRGEVVLFHHVDKPFTWSRLEDLRRLRIGTTLGYSYGPSFDAAVQAGELQVQQANKEDTNFRLLVLGRIDVHPQDRAVGYAMLRRLFSVDEQALIRHHPRELNREPLHLLFRKGDDRALELKAIFNQGLQRFVASGELESLQQALYAGNADNWMPQQP